MALELSVAESTAPAPIRSSVCPSRHVAESIRTHFAPISKIKNLKKCLYVHIYCLQLWCPPDHHRPYFSCLASVLAAEQVSWTVMQTPLENRRSGPQLGRSWFRFELAAQPLHLLSLSLSAKWSPETSSPCPHQHLRAHCLQPWSVAPAYLRDRPPVRDHPCRPKALLPEHLSASYL